MKAKIINNVPTCRNCECSDLSGIRNYDLVEWKGKKILKFIRKCKNCNNDVTYYKTISINGEDVYYDVNESEVKTIK